MALAAVGLGISGYFLLLQGGRVRPGPGQLVACGGAPGSTCVSLLATPQARVAGVPNYLLGAAYYGMVLAVAAAGWAAHPAAGWLLVGIGGVALAFSVYLFYQLTRVLRASCPWCLVAHGVNAALFCAALVAAVAS